LPSTIVKGYWEAQALVVYVHTTYDVQLLENDNQAKSWLEKNVSFLNFEWEEKHQLVDSAVFTNEPLQTHFTGVDIHFKNLEDAEAFAFEFDKSVCEIVEEEFDDSDSQQSKKIFWAYLDSLIKDGTNPLEILYGKKTEGSLSPSGREGGFQTESRLREALEDGRIIRPIKVLRSALDEWVDTHLEYYPEIAARREMKKIDDEAAEEKKINDEKWGKFWDVAIYPIVIIGIPAIILLFF